MISEAGAFYRWQDGDLILFCQLQPKASRDEFAGSLVTDQYGHRLKIRITAPPIDGKANVHLIEFLAVQFAVAKRAVHIVNGATGRLKTMRIENPKQLPAALSIAPPSANL